MKVLHQDTVEQVIRVRADTLDDLWHLSHLIEMGDIASATTWRAPDEARASATTKVEKRAMTLGVAVEQVEFQEFSNRLRLLGPIVEGDQDHGMYHTINVEPLTDLSIRKPKGWRPHHLERVKEAIDASKRPLVAFLAIEENEAVVALLRQYGVTKSAEIFGHVSGKQFAQSKGAEEDFFLEILMALRDYRPENAPLIVLGPGFAKERFMKYAREKKREEVKGAVIEPTGQAGMTGVHEAVRRGVVDRVQEGQRVAMETKLVEELFVQIATDGRAAYGTAEVERMLDLGAVETLLLSDDLLARGGEPLLERAKTTGATGVVVSTRHESGQRLRQMGGVAAILRYRPPT